MPTYREACCLPTLLPALLNLQPPLDVLIVDDFSGDETTEFLRAHPAFDRRLFLLQRPTKLGLGSAYRAAYAWAALRDYAAIVQMDADLSHDPADIPRLLAALDDGADLVVGSRYSHGISVVHWPLARLMLSMAAGLYARWIGGIALTDPTSGFKAVRSTALARINSDRIRAEGYGFQIELHAAALRSGLRCQELPIVFTERRNGQSKLSKTVAAEAIWVVAKLGVRRFLP